MRAQLGFRKPGKDSIYNGKRTTRIIQIVRFKSSGGASIEGARAPPLLEFFVKIIIKKRAKI